MPITTAQIRGARGILNWSKAELADRSGISNAAMGSIESGQSVPRETTLNTIQKVLETAGIEFISNDGVRKKSGNVRILKGRNGFWDFYEDIYVTVKNDPGEVVVGNVDERKFQKWLSEENLEIHVSRMRHIEGLYYKILLREGDTHYLATSDYAEYRWIPKEHFSPVPFYVYGNKLAILLFDKEPTVIILEYPAVSEAYRVQFKTMWNDSIVPPEKG